MKHAWSSTTKNGAGWVVGLWRCPTNTLANSKLVRPAVVELESGALVEVSLSIVDDLADVKKMAEDLEKFYQKNDCGRGSGEVAEPPKRLRRKRGRPPGKKNKKRK